jgi:tripartite-type tricarboxylate transporter receptor subunit TctC
VPVALVGTTSNLVVVNPALPVKSISELIAYGKANPGKLAYSSPGVGTPPHMIGEMLKLRTGLDITHVPYKSGGSSTQDVVSGQVPLTFENPAVSLPLVQAGSIRAIAVTSEARNPRLPDVATVAETIPDFVSVSFTGMVAPAGVSPAIVAKLNAAINESLKAPEVMATLAKLSVDSPARRPNSARSSPRSARSGRASPKRHTSRSIDSSVIPGRCAAPNPRSGFRVRADARPGKTAYRERQRSQGF